ncbi:hypothetical protein HYX06_05810 [Candidatus Woesearchaeota archaeon]|nr:hypothetical protein [Candidatus Woesearchaeota archaeon]
MKFYQKGFENWSLVVKIVVLTIVFVLIWSIAEGGIRKGSSAIINPLKKWAGLETEDDLERQKEGERVKSELSSSAEKVYTDTTGILKGCLNNDKLCSCGFVDFTKLNTYNLILRNERTIQTLALTDENKVPLTSNRIGTFLVLHSSGPGPFSDNLITQLDNYPRQTNYILFSQDKMEFNIGDSGEYSVEKEGDMSKVFFRKLTKDVLVAENFDLQLRRCSIS